MIKYFKIIFAGIFLFIGLENLLFSQFYESGQDPASIRWQQINTTNFQLIFSTEIEKDAQRFANILEYIYEDVSKTLEHKPRRISILLHNYNAQSNGFVVWAPKRSEEYTVAPQDIYAQQWLEQLAIHELRHVVQIDKLNQGLSHIFYLLFGEQAIGAAAGFIPSWLFEGDAVCTETAITNAGRGRLASFEKEIRAISLDKKRIYSFEKAILGSYSDYVPDHYQYGYLITSFYRNTVDSLIWSNMYSFVARNPYLIAPFYFASKKYTGLSKRALYRNALFTIREEWKKQSYLSTYTEFSSWNKRKRNDYTNYRFPYKVNDSTLIVYKRGIDQIADFSLVYKSGKEKRLVQPGYYDAVRMSYSNNKLVWCEYIPDLRWTNREYSVIKLYDLKTRRIKTLTNKSRYYAAAISNDGTKIATIEANNKNEYSLVIVNSNTGEEEQRFYPPNNNFIQIPSWNSNDDRIVLTYVSNNSKGIYVLDIKSNLWTSIIELSDRNISKPIFYKDYIIFECDFSGIDNLYSIQLDSKQIFQITSSKYGAYDSYIDTKTDILYYSDYTSLGYDVVESKIEEGKWMAQNLIEDHSIKLYKKLVEQEKRQIKSEDIPKIKYDVKSYSKLGHLFNLHSWALGYIDYDKTDFDENKSNFPGFTLLSQNVLGTAVSSFGYSYKNDVSYYYPKFTYKGFYPIIDFSGERQGFTDLRRLNKNVRRGYLYDFNVFNTSVYIPFNFTRNKYNRFITPRLTYQFTNANLYSFNEYLQKYTFSDLYYVKAYNNHLLIYDIQLSNQLKVSTRDLMPRFGQSLRIFYANSTFISQKNSGLVGGKTALFFPGIFLHNGIKLGLGYQRNFKSNLLSLLEAPRAYYDSRLYAKKYFLFSGNYAFPIIYPDVNTSWIFYLKRIKANLFYEYAFISSDNYLNFKTGNQAIIANNINTSGIELTMDFHVLNIIFPFNVGMRFFVGPQKYPSQLIFNFSLYDF